MTTEVYPAIDSQTLICVGDPKERHSQAVEFELGQVAGQGLVGRENRSIFQG